MDKKEKKSGKACEYCEGDKRGVKKKGKGEKETDEQGGRARVPELPKTRRSLNPLGRSALTSFSFNTHISTVMHP